MSRSLRNAPPHIRIPLSNKERTVLDFIIQFMEAREIAPSYQEIREHFGFASLNSVQRYLQQLQTKGYIFVPGGNLKRAITVLFDPNNNPNTNPFLAHVKEETPPRNSSGAESLSLPLLGRVAAGLPIEAMEHDEYVDIPPSMVRYPERSYALRVVGSSMIEDGILDGDVILVQKQGMARNGDTVVAMVNQQATVKKFYLHMHTDPQINPQNESTSRVELRPANAAMTSFWYRPDQVHIQGLVVGLLRQF